MEFSEHGHCCCGNGLRISKKEKQKWDKSVEVIFQKNAWFDDDVMKDRISNEWSNPFTYPQIHGSTEKILVSDVHRAQQIEAVKTVLQKRKNRVNQCATRLYKQSSIS